MSAQADRSTSRGWPRFAAVARGDERRAASRATSAITRSTAAGASSGPSASTTTAASTSGPSAASPHRSDAPGPRSQSGQGTAPSSSYAPETTTTSLDSAEPFEDGGKEQALLRRAEPRRGAGREDDGSDQDVLNRDALHHDRHRGRPVSDAERVDRVDRHHPVRDLADDGVLRPAGPMSWPVTTKNWLPDVPGASVCALRHRDDALRVGGVARRHVDGLVAGPAAARPGRIAALDDEAGDDAMERRAVVEAAPRRARRAKRPSSARSSGRARS